MAEETPTSRNRPPWLPLVSIAAIVLAVFACRQRDLLVRLFGPPKVVMREAYEGDQGAMVFDHSGFDELLRRHVREGGLVDYAGLGEDSADLDAYLRSLAIAPFHDLDRDEKLALLLNAYNAFTLRLILDHLPLDTIRDIPEAMRWEAVRWELAGKTYSLSQLEHEQIRPRFLEPRVHFALVCAAIGCPPLRSEAYVGARIDMQLEDQATYVHAHDRWFEFDRTKRAAHLTSLYLWYQGDFEQASGSPLRFAARYSLALAEALADEEDIAIDFKSYDWSLNRTALDR